jgi:hypothetical protein
LVGIYILEFFFDQNLDFVLGIQALSPWQFWCSYSCISGNPGGSTSVPNATFPQGCQTLYDSNGDICTDTGCGSPDPDFLINELGADGPGCMTFGNSLFAASSDVIGLSSAPIDVNCTGEASYDLDTSNAQAMADKYGATLEEVESLFTRIEASANTTTVCASTISEMLTTIISDPNIELTKYFHRV